MNKKEVYILILILAWILFQNNIYAQKQFNERQLFKYEIDENPEQTKLKAQEQYKTCPPLHPERFRRRIKMLWGIDVNDYPKDALIWFGLVNYRLSVKYQTISGFYKFNFDNPFELPSPPQDVYTQFRSYLLYNSEADFEELEKWRDSLESDELYYYDILTIIHNSVMTVYPQLLEFVDKHANLDFNYLHNTLRNIDVPTRVSDIKGDLLSLYIKGQINKGRNIGADWYTEKGIWMGFDLNRKSLLNLPEISSPYSLYTSNSEVNPKTTPWKLSTKERGVASQLSFMLQFNIRQVNKTIIQYMSGQLDYEGGGGGRIYKPLHEKIRADIKSNNYYGYSILREFCENPMREMPTLEKIGTNFTAKAKEQNTLLLLEPFADSYDIDTIHPSETFKAYEMGHDDYYFVEIEKPVESPVAD